MSRSLYPPFGVPEARGLTRLHSPLITALTLTPNAPFGCLPCRAAAPQAAAAHGRPGAARQRPGRGACLALGVTRVRADFGGILYTGTATEFFAPWFLVVFTDGDSADYNGHELASLLGTSENDSRLWFYDFSTNWHAGIYPGYSRHGCT